MKGLFMRGIQVHCGVGRWSVAGLLVAAAVLMFVGVAPAQTQPAGGKVTVLNGGSSWRLLYSWTLPQVQTPEGVKPRVGKSFREAVGSDLPGFPFLTEYPPEGWAMPDFDDAVWARQHFFTAYANGETDGRAGGGGPSYYTRQISLRGKFNVTDPDKVGELTLNLSYRGGAVVCVNGKEIKRANMPEGKLEPGALAEAYPDNVTVKPDGKVVSWYTDKDVTAEVYPKRVRKLEKVVIPAAALRKGKNVLAVEIHSAPYPQVFADYRIRPSWVPCGLVDISLEASKPDGIEPNVARPKGMQVWNANVLEYVHNVDWGDPLESLAPVRMVVAKNGVCTGRVVASSDQPIEGLAATLSELSGPGKIPASAVRISYGAFGGFGSQGVFYGNALRDDGMVDSPPKIAPVADVKLPAPYVAGAVQPVYVTVRVPKDAAAGLYKGTLTLKAAAGAKVDVPVELKVADWAVPSPADFTYWCGMAQVAEGPALQYNQQLWSDRHWQLVEKSFEWIAQVGSRVLFVPLAAQGEFGNAEGMVRFTKGADGKYAGDLSPVEKYLDVAVKHLGKPRYVICGVWGRNEQLRPDEQNSPLISVVGADGKVEAVRGPKHGTDESIELWKPVLTKIDAMLAARGLKGTLVLGMGDDALPNEATAGAFKKILPDAGWYSGRHKWDDARTIRCADGSKVPVIYQCNVYGSGEVPEPSVKRYYGWDRKYDIPGGQQVWLSREVYDNASLAKFREMPESMTMSDRPGQGCLGADFWPGTAKNAGRTLFSRYPRSANVGAGGKGITTTQLLYPGPDGAVPTLRFEMMREGIQEAEARIFLERLLLENPSRLPADLAKKTQDMLDERARWAMHQTDQMEAFRSSLTIPYSGWEDRTARLYEAAAVAAKAIAGKPAPTATTVPAPAATPAPAPAAAPAK